MARKMRDSGVEWIGEVPEGWEIRAIKKLALTDTSLLADGDWINSEDMSHDGIRYLTTGNIGQGAFKEQGNGYISDSTFRRLNCLPVYGGDLVISRLNEPIGRACIIPKNYKECVVAVDCVVLRPDEKFDKKFLMYAMSSDRYAEYGLLLARGTTMQRISRTQLGNMTIPIPPLLEQRRIADYLDEKCAAIDGAVDELKRGIEDCKAWKKAIIFEAVTGKANVLAAKNAKVAKRQMRDSGIPWIGEIPEGWEVKPLRRLGRLANGISKGGEYFGKGFPFVSYSDVYKNDAIPTQVKGLVEANDQERERYSVKRGDVFFTRTSETVDEIGIAAACLKDIQDSTFAGFLIRFRPMTDELLPEFSKCYFRNKLVSEYFAKELVMVTRASLGQELLKSLPVFIPPMKEQQAIADYLDEKCAAIDALVAEKEKLIADLEAYKKSLIFELVTGKREVA